MNIKDKLKEQVVEYIVRESFKKGSQYAIDFMKFNTNFFVEESIQELLLLFKTAIVYDFLVEGSESSTEASNNKEENEHV